MVIDLKKLRQSGKQEEDFFFEYSADENLPDVPGVKLALPVKILGKVLLTGAKSALVDADITYTLVGNCTRCLGPAERTYTVAVSEEFLSDGSDEEAYSYTNDKLDMTKAVDDALIMNFPVAFLCDEECKGIDISDKNDNT